MSSTTSNEYTPNDLITKMVKAKPKLKKSIEQFDTDSLNTMDYYKEDSSNKNSLIDESKLNQKLLFNPNNKNDSTNKDENINEKNDLSIIVNKAYKDIHQSSNLLRAKTLINVKKEQKEQKIQKRLNDTQLICCRCNCEINLNYKSCPSCKKMFCRKCFKGSINRNLDNNEYMDNFNHEVNILKVCPDCRKNENNNFNITMVPGEKRNRHNTNILQVAEPMDSLSESEMKNIGDKTSRKKSHTTNSFKEKKKSLETKYKEYDEFLNKIEDKKKEIEIKKNISINILQIIKKAIEYDYDRNVAKLNEIITKLNKIKSALSKKINKNYTNEVEIKIDIDTYKSTLNNFSKNYDTYIQKILSIPIFRGYRLYESNNILINHSDTYFMNSMEIMSNSSFGKAFLKIDRYTNNYKNYLNFSVQIKQNNKTLNEDVSNNLINNKSRYVVNMIIDNKVIRLNKVINKDNKDTSQNYECSEEENKILFSKDKINSNNNYKAKKNNFNVKVYISEIMI